MSSKLFSRVLGIGLVGLVVLSGSTAAWAGPVTTKKVISRKTLKPGVTLVHSRITVRGVFGAQEVYKLSWKFGNQHVSLHSSLLGAYDDSSTWITDHQISHLASAGGPPGMIAAMTGDYSIYQSWSPTRSTTSGITRPGPARSSTSAQAAWRSDTSPTAGSSWATRSSVR